MRVGSRESKLAMRQTEIFVQRMAGANPDVTCEVVGMKALGDIDLKSRLDQLPKTGAFVRELDDAIREMLDHEGAYLLVADVELCGMVYPMVPAGCTITDIIMGEDK